MRDIAQRRSRTGLTLVELMIVVSIIGILSAFFIARGAQVRQDATDARIASLLDTLRTAVIQYEAKTGSFPTNLTTASTQWDARMDTLEATLGSLNLPRWADLSGLLSDANVRWEAGRNGEPFFMGLKAVKGAGSWFHATPFKQEKCPNAVWDITGCTTNY